MATPTHQLTLVADERHYDLVVPVGTRVTDVLSALGISSSATPSSVATPGGHVYGPHDRLDDDLPAGTVLTVVRTTTHRLHRDVVSTDRSSAAPGGRSTAPAAAGGGRRVVTVTDTAPDLVDDSTRRREELDPDATVSRAAQRAGRGGAARRTRTRRGRGLPDLVVPALAVGLGLLCVVAAALGLADPPADAATGTLSSDAARWVASVALLAGAVVVTLGVPRDRAGAPDLRLAASPALAVAAGLTVPLGPSPQRVAVHGVIACALGVVVLALGSADESTDRAERAATACLGGLGVVLAAGVLLGWAPVASAALVVGLAPVLVRALPSASLAVDPTQLIDVDRLSTTVWAVRERHAGRRRRVTSPDVRERVAQARAVVSVGTAYLALFASVTAAVLAASPAQSDLAPWTRWALPAVAAVALGYQARTVRDRVARFAMLGSAAALTAASGYAVLAEHPTWVLPVAGTAVAVAAAAVVGAVALSGGYRSTRMS
ncbi:MAG TPA: hypothetical protein VLQ78_11990, partial [Ornithinibacter sp.]|nr:hypothetical protein [Ornithinibacter sp.]